MNVERTARALEVKCSKDVLDSSGKQWLGIYRPFDGKYSIVKEYVRGKKMDLDEKATVRFETMPGKQGHSDQHQGRILSSQRAQRIYAPETADR